MNDISDLSLTTLRSTNILAKCVSDAASGCRGVTTAVAETDRLVPARETDFWYNRLCHLTISRFGTREVRHSVVIEHGLTCVVMKR